jgi:hypothetical protein
MFRVTILGCSTTLALLSRTGTEKCTGHKISASFLSTTFVETVFAPMSI